jgi:hypothetical protein
MNSSGGGNGSGDGKLSKRSRSPSFAEMPVRASPKPTEPSGNTLSALLHPSLSKVRQSLFRHLSVEDGMQMAQTSKGWRSAIGTETSFPVLAASLTGVRTNTTTGQKFWTADPVAEPKRYFKPMSMLGAVTDVPHISEQTGFPSHATDVAANPWSSGLGSLPAGNYPTKVQFQGPVDGRPPYTLGKIDMPKKANEGRVLVPAPVVAKEPPNTLIPTRDYNRALNVPKEGPLPASRQRTVMSLQEANKPMAASQTSWHNAVIKGRDKPT